MSDKRTNFSFSIFLLFFNGSREVALHGAFSLYKGIQFVVCIFLHLPHDLFGIIAVNQIGLIIVVVACACVPGWPQCQLLAKIGTVVVKIHGDHRHNGRSLAGNDLSAAAKAEITQAVEYITVLIDRASLQNMRMMFNDKIHSRVDSDLCAVVLGGNMFFVVFCTDMQIQDYGTAAFFFLQFPNNFVHAAFEGIKRILQITDQSNMDAVLFKDVDLIIQYITNAGGIQRIFGALQTGYGKVM